MKNNKFLNILIILILLPVFFVACKSTSIPIPGQSQIISQNIYIEYMNLGDGYFNQEKYNDAIKCYKKAWNDKTLYSTCYYKVAKCYVYLSDWGNSLPMYEELLLKDPENSSLKASVGYIYAMSGEFNKAFNIYNDLISAQPNDEKYIENYLAIILADENNFKNNIEHFNNNFENLKKLYPENRNINSFQNKYDDLHNKFFPSTDEQQTDKAEIDNS